MSSSSGFSNESSTLVGLLVGATVLVFAAVGLSMMADKRFKFSSGRISLEDTVAEEQKQLKSLEAQVEKFQAIWAKDYQGLSGQVPLVETAERDAKAGAVKLEELESRLSVLAAEVEGIRTGYDEYRNSYRRQVRQSAAGEVVDHLVTTSGKSYEKVTIRRVTAGGLEIAHSEGFSRVSPRELPGSWNERFQWDQAETEAQLDAERAVTRAHERRIQSANTPASTTTKKTRRLSPEKEAERAKAKELSRLRREVLEAKRYYDRAEMELARVRSDAMSQRGRSVPGTLETWEEKIQRMEGGIAKFRNNWISARGRLASVAPNDPLVRVDLDGRER